MDGFPDLFVTFLLDNKGVSELQSIIFSNNPCTKEKCSKEASERTEYDIDLPRRYFDSQKSNIIS